MSKITYKQYLRLLEDIETPDEVVEPFSIVELGEGGFDLTFRPNLDRVELPGEDFESFSLTSFIEDSVNNASRNGRQRRFLARKARQESSTNKLPILVSEGDSWFQFPVLIKDVIDHLEDDFLIWSIGAGGDTLENMVENPEYLDALDRFKDEVSGFLFSAAGNDIVGRNRQTRKAALFDILKDFNGSETDIEGHINIDLFEQRIADIKEGYTTVINNIRSKPEFKNLPIFVHGYDYVYPFPGIPLDKRNPTHALPNQWLGKPLDKRGILNRIQRRNILKFMIDRLYTMLEEISANPKETGVWLVDCRGAMPRVTDWADEIHGTPEGFRKVADRFLPVISAALEHTAN